MMVNAGARWSAHCFRTIFGMLSGPNALEGFIFRRSFATPSCVILMFGMWSNYKHYQKECKRQIRKAECNYINSSILEGVEKNNTKPFWKYVKSRKQDNIGVAPLKERGHLINNSKEKAQILI
jgi:hypothetical protein